MIQAAFTIERKDYVRINLDIAYRNPTIILVTGIGVVAVLYYILSLVSLVPMPGHNFQPFSMLIFGLGLATSLPWSIYKRAARAYDNNPNLQGPINYYFSSDRIVVSGSSFQSELRWNSFSEIIMRKNYLLLKTHNGVLNIIPNTAWKNVQDCERVLEYARAAGLIIH
jgi:hypothetical protein